MRTEPCIETTTKILVVLGMHRSGTSLCMSFLQALGVRLDDDLIPGDANNEPGYFESRELIELNESILQTVGATWHSLFSLMLPSGWENAPELGPAKKTLREFITRRTAIGPAPWGFKDPRIAVLLPLYDQVFTECGLQPSYILCIRDPRAVARSLLKRNQFVALLSELLWLDHTIPVIQVARERLQTIVVYEKWFEDASAIRQVESLARAAGLEAGIGSLEGIRQRMIARELNHAEELTGDYELACSRSVYELLVEGDLDRATALFLETWQAIRLAITPVPPPDDPSDVDDMNDVQPNRRILSQLFWRSESGEFNELASAREFTDETVARRRVALRIPGGLGPQMLLRLDPTDIAGTAQLFSIRLLDSAGAVLWEWDRRCASLARMVRRDVIVLERIDEAGVFLFLPTSDPNILLPELVELDKLSESGGCLEFDFAWHGPVHNPSDP